MRAAALLLAGCSVVEVVPDKGATDDSAAPEQLEVQAELTLPPRGDIETGATVSVFCPEGYSLVEAERTCEASSAAVYITRSSVTQQGAHACGVRNDSDRIETVYARALCEAD